MNVKLSSNFVQKKKKQVDRTKKKKKYVFLMK